MYLYLVSLYHMTTNRLVLRMPLQDTPSHRRSSGVAVAHVPGGCWSGGCQGCLVAGLGLQFL